MNKKQKIIVSIVGITIVLLALLGLTYAYYLTRIQGNTNSNSINVTTADLRLVYRDGSANITETNIMPSDTEYTKVFTVKNEGNVNIEYGVYLIHVINEFTRKDDVKYTLTCITDGTLACGQVTNATTFPNGISELTTATIEPTKTHTYTFKFTYKDTGTDQSVDMGKNLGAKIQIFTKNQNGEYLPYEEGTLAYNLISKSFINDSNTPFVKYNQLGVTTNTSTPLLNNVTLDEHIMSSLPDMYGTSYFFRGAVENNWVLFNNACWRVIRIDGAGNIKMIYSGEANSTTSCSELLNEENKTSALIKDINGNNLSVIYGCGSKIKYQYGENEYYYNPLDYNNRISEEDSSLSNGLKNTLEDWFDKNFRTNDTLTSNGEKVKNGTWCLGGKKNETFDTSFGSRGYLTLKRIYDDKNIDLTCNNEEVFSSYIGAITADEAALAGASIGGGMEPPKNYSNYLNKNAKGSFWTLSYMLAYGEHSSGFAPFENAGQIYYFDNGSEDEKNSSQIIYQSWVSCKEDFANVRPVIILKSNVESVNATGTADNPYIVN